MDAAGDAALEKEKVDPLFILADKLFSGNENALGVAADCELGVGAA